MSDTGIFILKKEKSKNRITTHILWSSKLQQWNYNFHSVDSRYFFIILLILWFFVALSFVQEASIILLPGPQPGNWFLKVPVININVRPCLDQSLNRICSKKFTAFIIVNTKDAIRAIVMNIIHLLLVACKTKLNRVIYKFFFF